MSIGGTKTKYIGLVAGVTVGGAILSFTTSGEAAPLTAQPGADGRLPIAQRVERLREQIAVSAPTFVVESKAGKAEKLVQFFNFFNCIRGTWRNC